MTLFEFGTEVVGNVIEELKKAKKYIRIAIFQLHNENIFSVLEDRLRRGVRIEIFTLPYDSVNEDVRQRVTESFLHLEDSGARLWFCRWNVGDPGRTSTAVGRWYSFHAKFIVTDQCAIALSANFTTAQELDASITYRADAATISQYNRKFDELLSLYVHNDAGYEGSIRIKVQNTALHQTDELFALPPGIENTAFQNHWIQHYPAILCPEDVPVEEKLYLTPFDCRGREFLETVVGEAIHFAYFSTESFTDADFPNFLKTISLKGVDIRIITGMKTMDFSDRIQRVFRELLAYGIQLRTTEQSLHAKLLVTDKHLAVSSVNLNRMNLGFRKTLKYWRENTESIAICSEPAILGKAKSDYLRVFEAAVDVELKLAEKVQVIIKDMFTMFNLRSAAEVKELFSRFVVKQEIEVRKSVLEIGKLTAKLARHFHKSTVTKDEFLMSLILYQLSERKQDFDQLQDSLSMLDGCTPLLSNLLIRLQTNQFIDKSDGFYKIRLAAVNP